MTYDLCVVTDVGLSRGRGHMDVVSAAIRGGATMIQLREKAATTTSFVEFGQELRAVTREAGVPLIVNDRVDVALAVGADGVHVGQDDMPAAMARRLIGSSMILGISATTLEEALRGERDGADYLGVGPIFPTGTKPDAGPAMGISGLSAIANRVRIPIVAIGGIGPDNVASVIAAGAAGVAVVSAIVSAPDVEGAARRLRAGVSAAKAAHVSAAT